MSLESLSVLAIVLLAIALIVSAIVAINMNKTLRAKQPEVRPYAWGYFVGWSGVLVGGALFLLLILAVFSYINRIQSYSARWDMRDTLDLLFFLAIILSITISHVFIIRRNKWGWVFGSILHLNPISWIINGIYLKNCWAELKHPYDWGYFVGWSGVLVGGAFFLILAFVPNAYEPHCFSNTDCQGGYYYYRLTMENTLYILFFLSITISHVFIIRRNKWGWVFGSILHLNPISWIINGIYLKNRWTELNGFSSPIHLVNSVYSWFHSKPFYARVFIAGSIFWALAILLFVFVFEPNGHWDDWIYVTKVIFFPPLLATVGCFLFAIFVKQQKQLSDKSLPK